MKTVLAIFTFPMRLLLKVLIAMLKVVLEWLENLTEKKYPNY